MQTQRELMLVLDHITKGSSSVVTFADFCEAITPRYPNQQMRELIKLRYDYPHEVALDADVDDEVFNQLRTFIELLVQVEMDLEI